MRLLARLIVTAAVCLIWTVAGSGSAFAQAACNPNPSDYQKSQALESMGAGVAFLQDPDGARYEDAYPQFKKAYELSCSVNALQNLALCEMHVELDGDAIEHYGIVLAKKADLAEADRRQIESDLARLKATVAWVTLSSDKPGVALKDERTPRRGSAVRNTYQIGVQQKQLGIHPGSHTFTATNGEGQALTWTIEVEAGSRHDHAFTFVGAPAPQPGGGLTPQPPPPIETPEDEGGGLPVYVWAVGGVAVASAVVMAVFMGVSSAKKGTYDDEILGQASVQEQQDAASDVQTFSAVADAFIGITVAAAATTVVLALLAPADNADTGDNKEGPKFGVDYTVAPMVGDHGGGAALTVQF